MNSPDPGARRGADRDHQLALLAAGLYAVSLGFPIVGSVGPRGGPPTWFGVLDVAVAGALFVVALAVGRAARGRVGPAVRDACYHVYRVLAALPLALFVIFL